MGFPRACYTAVFPGRAIQQFSQGVLYDSFPVSLLAVNLMSTTHRVILPRITMQPYARFVLPFILDIFDLCAGSRSLLPG